MKLTPINLGARPKALARPQDLVQGGQPREWYRVQNADAGAVRVDIFDAIDSWGPPYGVSADALIGQLRDITAPQIDLHLNSPGGDVWDGIAILNALLQHPAHVTAYVDGVAASIASVIAMGADEVEMGLGAQLMIHDASTIALGNAAEMQAAADLLDKVSDNIAGVYAARTGLPAAHWREQMRAETWFNADEAVEAGLAHRMVAPQADEQPQDATRTPWTATWRYPGREHAPGPVSARNCAHADTCTHEPPHADSAPVAEPPAAPPAAVDHRAVFAAALRKAVTA